MQTVFLTQGEVTILDRHVAGFGGYQSLLRRLQSRINRSNGRLDLYPQDLEKIPRYAFDYGNGGWEGRLIGVFSRILGPRLGRLPARRIPVVSGIAGTVNTPSAVQPTVLRIR
jgi:hypothetical protein